MLAVLAPARPAEEARARSTSGKVPPLIEPTPADGALPPLIEPQPLIELVEITRGGLWSRLGCSLRSRPLDQREGACRDHPRPVGRSTISVGWASAGVWIAATTAPATVEGFRSFDAS